MKKWLILSFLLVQFCVARSQRNMDVLHYQFNIELNDKSDTLYGTAVIRLKLLATTGSISFDLVKKNETGKGMIVDSIYGPGIRGFVKDNDSVRIILTPGKSPAVNDTAVYTIKYHGIPDDGLIISKNKYGHRTFFSDNWPNRAHHWIPCNDDPADKASAEFIVTAPSHYQVVSNGVLVEETSLPDNKRLTHWKEDIALPTKVMVIGVADFAVNNVGDINCVPVSSWVFPENKTAGFYDYAQAKDILSFFMNYIGPYAYKKLANVQSKTIFGGMENASAIFYFENSVTGNRQEEDLLSHEIVHQWFGNMATEKSFAHLWLSEGFATYLTHVFIESKYGTDRLNKEMQKDREQVIDFVKTNPRPVVDETKNYMELLNSNSYQKGSWILHMLRRQLGDTVFHKAIRQYYAQYAGRNADTKDLQKVFETVSGKNLDNFFQQWLYSPVNPSLNITWQYLAKEKKISVTVEQLQKGVVFSFPLDLEINSAAKKTLMTLEVKAARQTFNFSVPEKPVSVKADPKVSLLFEGTVTARQ